MTLFKFKLNHFSNQCPQLALGPEETVSPKRRDEIHQIDPNWINWTEPKSVKHAWNHETLLTVHGGFFPFLVSGVVRVSHFSKPAGICWNLSLVASLGRAEWRVYIYVYIVIFFTACLQPKVRALQLSSSTIFNYSGIYDMFCHNFLAMPFNAICSCEMCVSTRNIGITAMHFVEWLMRLVRLVWDHGLSWNGTYGRKMWCEFDAVRSSTC